MSRLLLALLSLVLGEPGAMAAPVDKPEFVARLHGNLANSKGNLFYSPTSIRMALATAQAGAAGETAIEMKKVLELGDDPATTMMKLRADWNALAEPKLSPYAEHSNDPLIQKLAEEHMERRRVVLRVVNRLWGEKDRRFKEPFLTSLRDRYGAPMELLDFKNEAEASRVTINKWVSDQTEHKIEHLIPPPLRADTRLIITNAVYFKGQWSRPFEKYDTKPEAFHAPGGMKQVPMMHQIDHFRVAHIDNGLMLEMPYGDGDLVMDVILPDAKDGIATLEERFVAGAFAGWVAKLGDKRVSVALPSFKTQASLELADVLVAMGMKLAFKFPGADFSAMDGTKELYISRIIHQAYVAVAEQGTEVAAATATTLELGAVPPRDEPVKFRADHPFLVLIRDTRNGEALFVGRILDPKE